jgi:hypothetical protein
MARLASYLLISSLLLLSSCEDYVIMKPTVQVTQPSSGVGNNNQPSNCKAPLIEQNIIGTWSFVSNYNISRIERKGTVTFDTQKQIIDPDSLFENRLDNRFPVNRKTYVPVAQRLGYSGDLFEVQLYSEKGGKQSPIFKITLNECKKIHLTEATNQKTEITLLRQ